MGIYKPTTKKRGIYKTRAVSPNLATIEGLVEFAEREGLEKEARKIVEKPKLSFLQRLGALFTGFETGNAVYEARYNAASFPEKLVTFGKTYISDILTGVKEFVTGRVQRKRPKRTFKDILVEEGMKDRPGKLDLVDVVGFVGDVVTDPTTFYGGVIGKGIAKTGKVTLKFAEKIPVAGKVVKGVKEGVGELFVPFYKIKKVLGEKGEKYVDEFLKYTKTLRAEIDDFLEEISKRAKRVKHIPEAGKKIAVAVETRAKTGIKLLDEIIDELVGIQKKLTKMEKKRGILKVELKDYMHHMLTPEAAEFIKGGGDISGFLKPIRVKLGAAKPRKYLGIVKEINEDFEKRLGFKLFEEDAFKAFAKRGIDSIKAVRTYDFLQRVGNQFGVKASKNFIDKNGIKWVEVGAKELKGIRFPEPIAQHIDEFYKILTNDEATNKLIRYYDKALRFFKGYVTGWFPSFHTRNVIGAMFNNWIAGLKNPILYKVGDDILRGKSGFIKTKTGKVISYNSIRKMLKEYGVVGQTGYLDIGEYLRKNIYGDSTLAKVGKFPRNVMGFIEDRVRAPLFIDGLKKGLGPEKAAKRVIKYQFDYMPEAFTAFEKNIMRRVIPFYTWVRHNTPLQLEQMLMQPGKYAGVFKFERDASRTFGDPIPQEELELMPAWLRERFTIKAEGGYWAGFGTPFEDAVEKISDPLRAFGINLSPFIKTPIEQLTGYNIFKETKIDEDRYGKYYRNMPEPIKKWLELKEYTTKDGKKYYLVNPRKKYWLEVIGARGWNTALRLSNYTDDKWNVLSLLTTIKKYNYTYEDLKRWSDAELRKQLEDLLYKAGLTSRFQRLYVPKK